LGGQVFYFIEARFLQSGIKVDGSFCPVIKMKWVEGKTMTRFREY